MYRTSLYFDFKAPNGNADNVLRMFFEDWADQICDNKVSFFFEPGSYCDNTSTRTLRVDFINEEDAVAMKLKGVPDEFKKYLTLV